MVKKQSVSFDVLWKDTIEFLIEDFVAFFMPDLYPLIDFTVAPQFLEQELHRLLSDFKRKGIRFCDKLVKLHLKDGTCRWIFIHIEIQQKPEENFGARMFTYFYRLWDKHKNIDNELEAIAIFLNDKVKDSDCCFIYESGKTRIEYHYRYYKIFAENEDNLFESTNPFAIAILASRKSLQKIKDEQNRFTFKRKLVEDLLSKGYSHYQTALLLNFIKLAIELPLSLEQEIETKIYTKFLKTDIVMKQSLKEGFRQMPYLKKFMVELAIKCYEEEMIREKEEAIRELTKITHEKSELIREKDEITREKDEITREKDEITREASKAISEKEKIKRNSIKTLYSKGFPVEEIAECLEISIDEVKPYLNNINKRNIKLNKL